MNNSSKPRRLIVVAWMLLLLSLTPGWLSAATKPTETIQATILFFNDLHGHLTPFTISTDSGKQSIGGVARMATLSRSIRSANAQKNIRTITLVAGDILQGTPLSTVFEGKAEIDCLKALRVDAMTVGNHEFDFGAENFLELKNSASFPFLSANIIQRQTGALLCHPAALFPLADELAVTVIGVTTSELMTTTKASNVATISVLDPVTSVVNVYRHIERKGPVILLSHCKHETDRAIAAALPQLTAIIAGHDQILMTPYRKVGDVPIFQAFEKGKYLGRLDLSIHTDTGRTEIIHSAYLPITEAIQPDFEVETIVKEYDSRLDQAFKVVIGQAALFLDGERDKIRYQETPLGNFLSDIMRDYSGAEIALLNAGAIRASIEQGPITVADVFNVMPYANEIVMVEMTGEALEKALTRAVKSDKGEEDGGFLHVSGIRFEIHGRQVENLVLTQHNTPIQHEKTYTVAIPDFLATGGDGYDLFIPLNKRLTGLPLRELIIDAIREKGLISAAIEQRMNRLTP